MKNLSNDWFKVILNSMSDMVLVKGPKSKLLWANKSFLNYYGMTEEQLQHIIDAPHSDPDDTLQYVKDDHFVFTNGESLEIPSEAITRHDGLVEYFYTIKNPVFNPDNKVVMTVGTSRIVKDEKIIERSDEERHQYKASNSELKTLIHALPNPMIMLDASRRIISHSQEWQNMFISDLTTSRDPDFDNIYGKSLYNVCLKIKEVEKTKKLFELKDIRINVNDVNKRLDFKIKPWFFPNGTFGGTIIMANDITEIKNSEANLIEFNNELESKVLSRTIELSDALESLKTAQSVLIDQEKHASLGRMAGGIAHEINNPLAIINALMSYTKKLIIKNALTPEILQEKISEVEATVERITKIVNGLRTVSRDSKEFHKEQVNLRIVLSDVLNVCNERFKALGVEIILDINAAEYYKIYCDQIQLSQVFINILSNASDAIEDLPRKWIKISHSLEGSFDVLKFSDSGQGIPTNVLEKIYEPFYTSKPIGKGTGLGLAITKTILEKHGGTIEVDYKAINTTFIVKIPKCP